MDAIGRAGTHHPAAGAGRLVSLRAGRGADKGVRATFGSDFKDLFRLVGGAFLTPFVASLVALVLPAIVIFTVFGAVVGFFVWLATIFGGLWVTVREVLEIGETAKKLEHAYAAVTTIVSKTPPDGGAAG